MQERVESGGIVHRNRSLLHLHRPIQRWLTDNNFKSQTPRASISSSLEFQPPSKSHSRIIAPPDLRASGGDFWAPLEKCMDDQHEMPQLSHFRDSFKFMRNASAQGLRVAAAVCVRASTYRRN